ncbi:glycosyltransferase [Brevibacterium casei]|uniref:glycosyltransferase n=1 Tax=Brevibacterium casei TaxID=33889 RepID=UPI002469B6D5|nr:glycosyltransferase [Brevibacterium casei]MDH5147275.1 glycosyltransferase [Brevibacterium casei]
MSAVAISSTVLEESKPEVSIVIAVHNDEEFVRRSVESALSQTEANVEVICVDDASTDGTVAVIEEFVHDDRLQIITLEDNRSAYQARRIGVEAAQAPYVLFLDGDDELVPTAVEISLAKMREGSADVVGFGVEMVMPSGQGTPRFERSLQPKHPELLGDGIVSALFPTGHPAQGHLWKYLFSTDLLHLAYSGADRTSGFYRANDIPVSFLALSAAQKYVSTTTRLYRYFFRRGTSGQSIHSIDDFRFYLSAIDSIDSVESKVPDHALRPYRSARRSMISNLVRDCLERTFGKLQAECLDLLIARVGALDVILSAADFCRESLPMLVSHFEDLDVPRIADARSVVVTTSHLKTGGLQGVLAAQVHYLVKDGIDVTVALHQPELIEGAVSSEAEIARINGTSWAEKILSLLDICARTQSDVIIDHHILYNEYWPFYALAARTAGIGTIGWLHNFALRPMFNGSSRLSFLVANMPALETLVVLSPTDAAFWSLSGVHHVAYLPNPLSPMLLSREAELSPKTLGPSPIKLVWWGRLQQSTKQVSELLEVAKHLDLLGVEFQLSIIGPDGPDMTGAELIRKSEQYGIEQSVDVVGPLYGEELTAAIRDADVFLMTSAIEGYPLTLAEGQASGLPIIMYDLPWLAYLADNAGIRIVPQMDSRHMAAEVAEFVENPQSYNDASEAAVDAVTRVFNLDFGKLYRELIEQRLGSEFTPQATPESFATLLRLSVEYSERTARRLDRAESNVRNLEKKLSAAAYSPPPAQASLPDIEKFQEYRTRPSSLVRRVLAKLLPSTWRQANFIAERSANWNYKAFKSVARQQQEMTRSIRGLQDAVKASAAKNAEIETLLRSSIRGDEHL